MDLKNKEMIFVKKISLLLAVVVMISVLLCGCGAHSADAQLKTGYYMAEARSSSVSADGQALMIGPYVSLDTENKTFIYGQSLMMSYAEYGSYEIIDGKLVATVQNGNTYDFEIKDGSTLVMLDDDSKAIDEFVYSDK